MKALVMHEYNKLTYQEVPTPEPGDQEVQVRLQACAVCGSDVHGFDGSSGRRRPPIIMGHEAAGVISACGRGVKGYQIGERVTFDSTVYCNACDACKRGYVNLCANRQVLGVSCEDYRRNGCFAEYVTVPAYILYKLPDNVTYVQAAMVEPLSIALHAATRTKIGESDTVAVVGAGTIGMLILQVVRSFGAKRIIALDIDDERLEIARVNGADYCINSKDTDACDQVIQCSGGGVDVAIDATGIPATFDLCVHAVALGGRVVLVGNIAQQVDFPLQYVVTRQISLFGSCASAGESPDCLRLLSNGKVDVDGMISKIVPLAEGDYWMNKLYRREDGLAKLVFRCGDEE